ncbi:MAG: IclR family transcriptional regulator [Actinobacteria bacterium]|nr:IclR family transcriptional regulator [Actinomycetota bacterium]MCB1039129.1 IclR family transcriptional regulator [Acidimicrobiales bacterium]
MGQSVSGVGVVDKSMAVLDAVARADRPLGLADLVGATGLPRATAHRLASALAVHGLLHRTDEGRFALGARLVGLGHAAAAGWPVAAVARPHLVDLCRRTGESAQLYVREDEQRVCLVSIESPHELRTIVAEGARLPLAVGSAGRLLAGERPDEGWTASVEERARGVASVSAAVRDGAGRIVAAVGISGPVGRVGADPGATYGPAVRAAAIAIERDVADRG